jgi:hypothetical protein
MSADQYLDAYGCGLYLTWLCEHLALLTSDADNQERYLRATGTSDLLDELGLEGDDYYEVLQAQPRFQRSVAFDAVSRALTDIPRDDWRGRAALDRAAWENVRTAARLALASAMDMQERTGKEESGTRPPLRWENPDE